MFRFKLVLLLAGALFVATLGVAQAPLGEGGSKPEIREDVGTSYVSEEEPSPGTTASPEAAETTGVYIPPKR